MVAAALKWNGNFVWACKNYDGDVQSDTVAQGLVLLGINDFRAYYSGRKNYGSRSCSRNSYTPLQRASEGNPTSTNPVASIFAWTRGLEFREFLDGNKELVDFCKTLEQVCIETIESGKMTKDLAICIHGTTVKKKII